MSEPSGTHEAKKRLATEEEYPTRHLDFTRPYHEKLPVAANRPSDPDTFKVKASWLKGILGPIIGAAVAGGVIYGATLTRVETLEARDEEITSRLEIVATEGFVRDEALNVRVYSVERDQAVGATEQRATARALEAMAEEMREMRVAVQRLRR